MRTMLKKPFEKKGENSGKPGECSEKGECDEGVVGVRTATAGGGGDGLFANVGLAVEMSAKVHRRRQRYEEEEEVVCMASGMFVCF